MTYAQPAVKLEDLRLPGLDGMLPGAKVKGRDRKQYEYLVDAASVFMDRYKGNKEIGEAFPAIGYGHSIDDLYPEMYKHVKNELLQDVTFTKEDLDDFLFIQANNNYSDSHSQVLGLYTGCLLELLTERYKAAGLPTSFYFNGDGNIFDYLFVFARNLDEVIVDNFKGDFICSRVASFRKAKANLLMIKDCEGEYIADYAGSCDGQIGLLVAANNQGDEVISNAASFNGEAGTIIAINNESDSSNVGSDIAASRGKFGFVIALDNRSKNHVCLQTAHKGYDSGMVMLINNDVSRAGYAMAQYTTLDLVVTDSIYPPSCVEEGEETIALVYVNQINTARKMSRLKRVRKNMVEKYHVHEVIKLAESMRDKDYQEMLAIAKQINAIQQEVRGEPRQEE